VSRKSWAASRRSRVAPDVDDQDARFGLAYAKCWPTGSKAKEVPDERDFARHDRLLRLAAVGLGLSRRRAVHPDGRASQHARQPYSNAHARCLRRQRRYPAGPAVLAAPSLPYRRAQALELAITVNIEPKFYPADIDLASCVVIAAQGLGLPVAELVNAIMRAVWAEDRNVADPATIADIATGQGLDAANLLAAAATEPVRAEYRANTGRALDCRYHGDVYQPLTLSTRVSLLHHIGFDPTSRKCQAVRQAKNRGMIVRKPSHHLVVRRVAIRCRGRSIAAGPARVRTSARLAPSKLR
jgi:hypothetical protein